MNNVIPFKHQEDADVEAGFIDLLETHCAREGAVKPLSTSFFERIERLKAKAEAEAAKQHQEDVLLEG
jgi:hypothetical protein